MGQGEESREGLKTNRKLFGRLPGNFDRFLLECSKSIEQQALNRRTFIVSVVLRLYSAPNLGRS